jgi:ATP-binding cassette subfamily F protein uup
MVAQRGSGVAAKKAPAPDAKKTPMPPRERTAVPRKLTYTDKHALETLPAQIAALEKDIAALHDKVSAPDFYTRDPKGFAAASAKLEAAHTELTRAESRWLELEILREELARS